VKYVLKKILEQTSSSSTTCSLSSSSSTTAMVYQWQQFRNNSDVVQQGREKCKTPVSCQNMGAQEEKAHIFHIWPIYMYPTHQAHL